MTNKQAKKTQAARKVSQSGKIGLSGAPVSLQDQVMAMLPAKLECPHCHEMKKKALFGVRVVSRDSRGQPDKVIRQSWCQDCRNGTYSRQAASVGRPASRPAKVKKGKRQLLKEAQARMAHARAIRLERIHSEKRQPTTTVLIARPTKETVKNGHGDNLQYAGMERQVHIFRFATKKDLKNWVEEMPGRRIRIEKPIVH